MVIALFVACGCSDSGADEGAADTLAPEVVAPDTGDATDAEPDIDSQTPPPSKCAVQVDKAGTDSEQCGSADTPCATITRALAGAAGGCIQVGPGTYSSASGETLPLRLNGVALQGAGHDPNGAPTIIDGSTGKNTEIFTITCGEKSKSHKATLVMEGDAALAGIIAKAPLTGTNQFAVLVLSGTAKIHDMRTEGGVEGIFTAGASVVSIKDCEITQAGHAGIKPGGTSQVLIDSCVIWQNKDAVEPVCAAKTTIQNTEAFCNGNGLEALGSAHTTLIGNHVHHNENGIAARGDKAVIFMRNNVVENNIYGVLMIFSTLDMGTADDPGNNTLINNEFGGLMLRNVPEATSAVGNIWMPGVDGADDAGQYSGNVSLSISAETCPNTTFSGNIDKAVPANCTGSGTVTPDASYQNIVLFNASCSGTPEGPMPTVVLSER
jgi:hypothetical protein